MQAAGELPQLLERVIELGARSLELPRGVGIAVELRAHDPEAQRQRHEALLCSVMEVALQAAAGGVARFDDACAEALSSSTFARRSAARRSFSSANVAAEPTARTSSRSSSRDASWIITAAGFAPDSSGVTTRSDSPARGSTGLPASSTYSR